MPHDPAVLAAARVLAERRRAGEQGPRLPEACRPDSLEAAFAIQSAVIELMGERIGAWKCGLPAPQRLVAAPIHASTVHTVDEPCPVWTRAGQVRVEPELAFILGRDLPPRDAPYTPADVDAAIARTHIALELIDTRYLPGDALEASFAEKLADGLVNQGLFLGPEVDGEQARMAGHLAITVNVGSSSSEHAGQHPNAEPRAPLYWLAEFLRSRGQGLQAGEAVITGSYAGALALPLSEAIAIQFGDLGTLSVCFGERSRQ
jgi:2-keto-4-pentenoate hydratase